MRVSVPCTHVAGAQLPCRSHGTRRRRSWLLPSRASVKGAPGSPAVAPACPCGSGKPYASCCQPLHSGTEGATKPVQLLRARFAAYSTGHVDYIVSTTHADNSQLKGSSSFREDVKATCDSFVFSHLQVLREEGTPDPHVKLVTFRYECAVASKRGFGGKAADKRTVEETSVFVLLASAGGRWVFFDSKEALAGKLIAPS